MILMFTSNLQSCLSDKCTHTNRKDDIWLKAQIFNDQQHTLHTKLQTLSIIADTTLCADHSVLACHSPSALQECKVLNLQAY